MHSISPQSPPPSEGRPRQPGCSPLHPSACCRPARQWLEASCHVTPAQRTARALPFSPSSYVLACQKLSCRAALFSLPGLPPLPALQRDDIQPMCMQTMSFYPCLFYPFKPRFNKFTFFPSSPVFLGMHSEHLATDLLKNHHEALLPSHHQLRKLSRHNA